MSSHIYSNNDPIKRSMIITMLFFFYFSHHNFAFLNPTANIHITQTDSAVYECLAQPKSHLFYQKSLNIQFNPLFKINDDAHTRRSLSSLGNVEHHPLGGMSIKLMMCVGWLVGALLLLVLS